ncbi:MAG: hypothetical protein EOP85_04340 [Verrucomicrobiaceae bacterium]|nr:MAG: hypothetical protein EOP85_04340 [Verrucomicrobiaceae bacterium]
MKTQPPPDVPAPPPSKAAILSRRKWNCLKVLGILSILFVLAGLAAPMFIRCQRKADQTEAVSNARQIGIALSEFYTEYGSFPDASTIGPVRDASPQALPMRTTSSNDLFRQLFISGIVQSESMFVAKFDGTRMPDNVSNSDEELLKRGECGFTYLMGARETDHRKRPLLVTAMTPATDRFDRSCFDGKVVILRLDNSVSSHDINKDGHVYIDGRNLMDPNHPVWEGRPPTIVWPAL